MPFCIHSSYHVLVPTNIIFQNRKSCILQQYSQDEHFKIVFNLLPFKSYLTGENLIFVIELFILNDWKYSLSQWRKFNFLMKLFWKNETIGKSSMVTVINYFLLERKNHRMILACTKEHCQKFYESSMFWLVPVGCCIDL